MIDNTINDGKTVAGGGKDVTLAGLYHIIRQLGTGGLTNDVRSWVFYACNRKIIF